MNNSTAYPGNKNNFLYCEKIIFIYFFTFILFFTSTTHAQMPNGHFDEWGQVTADELDMTACSFDKDADAELLLDLAQMYFAKTYADFYTPDKLIVTTAYYQRYKVFTENGVRKANRRIVFRNAKGDSVTDISAVCYNPGRDGQMELTRLTVSDIHYTKLNEYESEATFTVPGVKKGSVFELAYKKKKPVDYHLPDWYFTSDVPVAYGKITIGYLDALEYFVDEHIRDTAKIKKVTKNYTSTVLLPLPAGGFEALNGLLVTYTAVNLPPFHSEPFTNSSNNYNDRLAWQLKSVGPPIKSGTWYVTSFEKLAMRYMQDQDFGGNLQQMPGQGPGWGNLINDNMTPEQKARAVYDFVRRNLDWNGITATGTTQDIPTTWKLKTGNSAEINFLLINTLRAAGLNAYPALVPTRSDGYMNTTYPMLRDLDKTIVMLELTNRGKFVLLDATDKFLPFGLIAFPQLNNSGIVINGQSDYYIFDTYNQGDNTESTLIKAVVDAETGEIHGNLQATFDNYLQARFRSLEAQDKESSINGYMKRRISSNVQSSFDSLDVDNNLFMHQTNFSSQAMNDNEGNLYVSISSIYGLTVNPFTSADRSSDVDFGYRQHINTIMQLPVPSGYVLDPATQPIHLSMPDSSIRFSYTAQVKNDTLYVEQRLDYLKSLYLIKDYQAFYAFHHDYYKLMQQPVVLRKHS